MPLGIQLILSCLQQDDGEQIVLLCQKTTDWDALIKLINRHRVLSQTYKSLNQFAANDILEPVLSHLRKRFNRNTKQVLLKTGELVLLLKQFQKNHIHILPLKGPVLALQIYGDLGSRHVGDLDLLVSPENIKKAEDILCHRGYKRIDPDFQLTRKQHSVYVRNNHHFEYFCQERKVKIELHWRSDPNPYLFPLSFDEMWNDRQTIKVGGANVAALSLEHTLFFLCVHGAGHEWFRLFWLNDVAQLMIKNDSLDWDIILKRSEELGISRMVAEAIVLVSSLFGTPLPKQVFLYAQKHKAVYQLAKNALYLINHPEGPFHKPFTKPYFYSKLHKWRLRSNFRYKLAFCVYLLNAGYDDWDRVPLPDALFPLYYLLRPVTWFSRWYVRGKLAYKEKPMDRKKNGSAQPEKT